MNKKSENSVAFQSATTRVSFLHPRIVRVEFSESGAFEDRPTMCVVKRPKTSVATSIENGPSNQIVIRSEHFTIELVDNGRLFTRETLRVTFPTLPESGTWHPGAVETRNLGGTLRTLDMMDGDTLISGDPRVMPQQEKLCNGLLSQSGWSVHDDSDSIAIDPKIAGGWVAPRHDSIQDFYIFAFGLEFKEWIAQAAIVFGAQPLPPRYAFGYWWSRYWAYTDQELEEIADECDTHGIPLDVMVIDMDWHQQGWTGFSWDRAYFPDPSGFFKRMSARGLHCSMNLHPADGFAPHEDCYEEAARALGIDPKSGVTVDFDCVDPVFMQTYFDTLKAHEDRGVEFWWLDWQQGSKSKMKGLDPLPWLNHLHYAHLERKYPERRPLNFSRYGGLGAGRYPIGFSGDSYVSWTSLKFQPHLTAAAANVLFGYWSHDIGGHFHGELDPELYTRWLQFGAYSPILRTHATKQTTNDRQFWETGLPYSRIMKNVVRRRYELVPYIYSECRQAFDSGVSLCRPMYYEHPELSESYNHPQQYYFGSKMIVAPVNQKVEEIDQQAAQNIYLPPGEWYSCAYGEIRSGGKNFLDRYLIDEVPVFVRAGTIIPGQVSARRLSAACYQNLLFDIYSGDCGEYTLYEDDGHSSGYQKGQFARTRVTTRSNQEKVCVEIEPSVGTYVGFDSTRSLTLRFHRESPAQQITINGKSLSWCFESKPDTWRYCGDSQTIIVTAASIDLTKKTSIVLERGERAPLNGFTGSLKRVKSAFDAARVLELPYERQIAQLAQIGNRISRDPSTYRAEIEKFSAELNNLVAANGDVRTSLYGKAKYLAKKLAALERAHALLRHAQSIG